MSSRRTVSVLFTDVVGSTELRGELGDERADEVLGRLHRAECEVVAGHDGTVVKALGDGLMAVFDSAADAVDAAGSLQAAARTDDAAVGIRVGVSAGDARMENGDWFGTPVVEAARLCAAAPAGGVLISDLAKQLAGTRTSRRLRSIGPLALKGLRQPVVAHAMELDAAVPVEAATPSALRVCIVGRFTVERGFSQLDEAELGSRKARALLKLLAVRRGQLVAMDTIVETLWADSPPARVEANVATLVSRLRGALGADVIAGGRTGYRLAVDESLSIDVDEAEHLVGEAEHRAAHQPALALTAAEGALAILSVGRVLDDEPGAEWASDANREVGRILRRARAAAWQAHLDLGDNRSALAIAQDAIAQDAIDEEAHRTVMLCYHRLGEQGEALRAYERLRTTLVEELGADPGPETTELFTAVLRGEVVDAVRPGGVAPHPGEPSFVGRDGELGELLDLWARATRGESGCVLLVGEAGIGKTRLATELAGQIRSTGALVLRARCYEAERSLFLQPVVEIVREAVATLAPQVVRSALGERGQSLARLVPELKSITPGEIGVEVGGEIERRRTFEAVAQLFTGLARGRPLLLFLDDLHEAGASTVELLHFTLRSEPRARMMVVATVRADEADAINEQLASVASTVEVTGLTRESIRAIAERMGFGDRADTITALTKGHTLFAVEALRALADAGAPDEATAAITVPPSLRDAVAARVRRCGPQVEEALRAAVVIGSAFEVTVLSELLGVSADEMIRRAETARRAGIIAESGSGYEFSNDLIRDVLYDTTPKPARVVHHRRLATLFKDHPEAAALHAQAAGDTRAAVMCWRAAASRATSAFANKEADELLTQALDASVLLRDNALTAALLLARGRARLALGHYAASAEDLSTAEQLARSVDDDIVTTEALTERGWAAYHARDMVHAEALAEQAIVRPHAGPRAAILVGRVRDARGNLAGSLAILRSVADETDQGDRAYALSCLGTALAHSDRYDDALPVLEEAVAACRRTGVLRGLLNARMFGAIVLANLGRFAGALTWAEQLLADADRFDAPYYHPRALNTLALVWRELGEPSRARDLAEEALETSVVADGQLEGEPAANARLALAESALTVGDLGTMAAHLDAITPLLSDRVAYAWRIELRRLEIAARVDPTRADDLLAQARAFGSAKYEALALALVGETDEAVAIAQTTGSPWLLARVGPEPIARSNAGLLAADLVPELRAGFVERGPLLRRFHSS